MPTSCSRARCAAASVAVLLAAGIGGCSPTDPSVREYVDQALAGLDEGYYADSREWREAVDAALPDLRAAESIPDTYGTLADLTKVAGGAHSFFSTPRQVAAWELPYPEGEVPVPTASFDGSVATLEVPGFSSSHADEIEQYRRAAAAILGSESARDACGWIIDVGGNTGGDLRVMLVAVSPLLDDGVVEKFQRRDGSTDDVVVRDATVSWGDEFWGALPGEPDKLAGRPIAILQSARTASAGESVILAFSGQDGVETFGSVTAGFTTVNDGFELPDGAFVTLSFALMGDRDGRYPEGPIVPDHETSRADGAALAAAREWIAGRCASS